MYTLLISGLILFTSAHVASVALTNHVLTSTPAPVRLNIDVPAAAKATIARLYPGVKAVKWEKEDGNYEAGLTHKGKKLSLVIDAKGNVLETETTIAESSLPASVRAYVAKHQAGKKKRKPPKFWTLKAGKPMKRRLVAKT